MLSRRQLERTLCEGRFNHKETVTNYDKIEVKGSFKFDKDRLGVYCLQFGLDRKYLLAGYADGCVQALTYEDGKPKVYKELKKKKYGGLPVTCIRFHPCQHEVAYAASSDGCVYACNLTTGTSEKVAEEKNNEINGLDFNCTGKEFVTGGKDLCVRLYDVETNNMLRKWKGYNANSAKSVSTLSGSHNKRVFCVKYNPEDRDIFLSGGWENHVKVWDSRLANPIVKELVGPHICGDSIDFAGHKVLTGSWSQHDALYIWDLRYNKVLQTLPFHVAPINEQQTATAEEKDRGVYLYCAQFADRETVLAGGSGTHSIQAISVTKNEVIGELKLHGEKTQTLGYGTTPSTVADNVVQALDSTDGGRYIAYGGLCNELIIASLDGGAERELTEDELHPKD